MNCTFRTIARTTICSPKKTFGCAAATLQRSPCCRRWLTKLTVHKKKPAITKATVARALFVYSYHPVHKKKGDWCNSSQRAREKKKRKKTRSIVWPIKRRKINKEKVLRCFFIYRYCFLVVSRDILVVSRRHYTEAHSTGALGRPVSTCFIVVVVVIVVAWLD